MAERHLVTVEFKSVSQDDNATNIHTVHREANMKLEDVKKIEAGLASLLAARASE